jgi:hypothetical protein
VFLNGFSTPGLAMYPFTLRAGSRNIAAKKLFLVEKHPKNNGRTNAILTQSINNQKISRFFMDGRGRTTPGANQIVAVIFASPQTPLLAAEGLCEEHYLRNTLCFCDNLVAPNNTF